MRGFWAGKIAAMVYLLRLVWRFFWGWGGLVLAVLGVLFYGPKKMLETWDWYIARWDSKVLRAIPEETKIPPFKMFARNPRVRDLATNTGRSERSVENSLKRLAEKKQVEFIDGGWSTK